MVTEEDIKRFLATHNTEGLTSKQIARLMVNEAILNTAFADQKYKEKLLGVIDAN